MSVWPQPSYEIPITTQRVTRAAFPHGCLTIRIRDELGELFCDKDFAELFAVRGRPALSPARLALVSVLQFVEGLTDRQAADAVRSRLDWKYLLGLELADPVFDASVLTEFRSRLATDGQAKRLLGLMLDRLRERDLLAKGGRQRTDATHVIMAARWVNRLEQVQETVRAALEVLAAVAPSWLVTAIPDGWYERYGQRGDDWRLPKSAKGRADMAIAVGEDGYLLLEALNAMDCPAWLGQVEAVQILRLTWIQQYYRDETTICLRDKDLGQPPGARLILSPYDIDARYAAKRGRIWRGYKGHFTETCEPDQPHVIVHVTTTPASTGDIETVKDRYADLAAADLLPSEHFVDTGYVSVDVMLAARDDYGIDLIGPLPPDTSWQAKDPKAFDLTRFDIDWDHKKVICPNGKTSRNWQHGSSRDGLPVIEVTFRRPDCEPCPDRPLCTRASPAARGLTFRPQRQVETQRKQRREQETDAWLDRYAIRSGAESLMAQASRRSGIHQARYRGLAKTFLQHVLTAMAINLIRINAWLTGETTTGSWASRLTRLYQTLTPT